MTLKIGTMYVRKAPLSINLMYWLVNLLLLWIIYVTVKVVIDLVFSVQQLPESFPLVSYLVSHTVGLLGAILAIISFFILRKFAKNLRNGELFTHANVTSLRRFSACFALLALTSYAQVLLYDYLFSDMLGGRSATQNYFTALVCMLLFSLFVFALAHVFSAGLKLREEHELTV